MKKFLLTLSWLTAGLTASATTPELRGIYIEDSTALFVLVDPDTGESSRWLALGREFEGYTLQAFQSEADTIVLAKDGTEHRVKLRAAKVKYAATTLSGTLELGAGRTTSVQRATLVFGEENTFPVADGLTLTIKPVQLKDGNIAYESRFEQTAADGRKETLASPRMIVKPGMAFSMRVGELGFSLQP